DRHREFRRPLHLGQAACRHRRLHDAAPDRASRRSRRLARHARADGGTDGRQGAPMIALTIYSRPGCHLCEEMKATIERTLRRGAPDEVSVEEIDISSDADLETRYGLEIPVLLVNGRKAAKYRVSEGELTRILRARE